MSKYEVCPQCEGEGKMVNRAVSVWTASDREEDPEGFEAMMNGDYDVLCDCCKGLRVVTPERLEEFHEERRDHRTMLAEQGIYPGSPDYD